MGAVGGAPIDAPIQSGLSSLLRERIARFAERFDHVFEPEFQSRELLDHLSFGVEHGDDIRVGELAAGVLLVVGSEQHREFADIVRLAAQ